MTKHSTVVGSSTAGRVLACPGSIIASRNGRNESSSYADTGSMLHHCMEVWADTNKWPEIGSKPGDFDIELTQELKDTKLVPAAHAFMDIEDSFDGPLTRLEKKLELFEIEGAFGTGDVVIQETMTENRLAVIDYKFGDGIIVSAHENKQMMFLACGVLDEIEGWQDTWAGIDLYIIQPARDTTDPVSHYRTGVTELSEFYSDLILAVDEGLDEDPRYETGDHCRFCPGATSCPKMVSTLHELAAVSNEVTDDEDGPDRLLVAEYTDAELASYLEAMDVLQDWHKALAGEAVARIEAGGDVPGWKLVQKRATRKWLDVEDALAYFRKKRYPLYRIQETVLKSPAKMEKELGHGKIPSELLTKDSTGVTLTTADDPRAAVTYTDVSETLKQLNKGDSDV